VAGETVGTREDLDELFRASGLGEVGTMALDVATDYEDFDELWSTFLLGVGPSGQYAAGLEPDAQEAVREDFRRRLDLPAGSFTLSARSWAVRGRIPSRR
jgi:hypothetical protein